MCDLSPLVYIVIAFLVISTAQKTLESIINELHITNFITSKPIRLLNDTYRQPKVNFQAILRLFIILLRISLSIWIVFSTMVDKDVKTRPGPISKNQYRLYSKDEHEKKTIVFTNATTSSKHEQHFGNLVLNDVVQRQDKREEEDQKVCDLMREFVTGKAKQCIKCSFLYDHFHLPSNRSFQTYPAIPVSENEELNQEIPYFRLGNTRAVLDGNPTVNGYANYQTVNLSAHRRRNLQRIGSETNNGLNSLMVSSTSSGFNSLTVYDHDDPGLLVTSNRRNDFPLMSSLSNRGPTISSSGYESGRGIRHVISGSFTFSLGLQVDRDTNEEQNNQINYSIQQDEQEHMSGLMSAISDVSVALSCLESEHEFENHEGNEAVDTNMQMSEICPAVDLSLPESPRIVQRTVRAHDLLACANQQENVNETLLVLLHNMTELKETESSCSSQSSMQASGNISLQAVSQTCVPPHNISDRHLDLEHKLERFRQTGDGEKTIHSMTPVSSSDNQGIGNIDESNEVTVLQTQPAIQPISSSSGGINEHAHRNGNHYGSYNRLQNDQFVDDDDDLFGDGQPHNANSDEDEVNQ